MTDAMHPLSIPLPDGQDGNGAAEGLPGLAAVAGPVTRYLDPQALFAGEPLGQALRQLEAYGRDGLPVISGDGQHIKGWVTTRSWPRPGKESGTGSGAGGRAAAGVFEGFACGGFPTASSARDGT